MSKVKWTCQRCGLQRDDRRGSNCNGVQGQSHDWEETWWVEKLKEKEKWLNWLNSSESLDWKDEYENIKMILKNDTENIQNNYLQELNKNKVKFNEIINKYNVKISELKEYENKIIKEIKKRGNRMLLIFTGIAILGFLFIAFLLSKMIFAIFFAIMTYVIGRIIKYLKTSYEFTKAGEIYSKDLNEAKYELQNSLCKSNLPYEWNDYWKKIDEIYENEIKKIIQKGKLMITKNDQKHKFEEYSYNNSNFNYAQGDYGIDYDIRKVFIADNEFKEKYDVGRYH